MTSGPEQVLGFHSYIEKNRQVFSLQHAFAYYAFFGLCEYFDHVGRRLQTGRDRNGKSRVSLIPFLLLAQRQSMNAFEALSSCRSYEAWVLVRPAIEAALIMGKWVDDPENAAIWNSRGARRTEYIKSFTGKGLVSKSLPRAAEIRSVLDRLNDEFVHANEPYYSRHTTAEPLADGDIFLRVDFFDRSDDVEAHAVAFLHLVAVMLDSLDAMLAATLPTTGEHLPRATGLREELRERAMAIRTRAPQHELTIRQLGLWPNDTAV